MITSSNVRWGGGDAQPSGGCFTSHHVRYRAVPGTNRTPSTANTHSRSATSSTNESPAGAPSLPWLCSCADALPSECTDVASPDCSAQLLEQPLPARSATRSALVRYCPLPSPSHPGPPPSNPPPPLPHPLPHYKTPPRSQFP